VSDPVLQELRKQTALLETQNELLRSLVGNRRAQDDTAARLSEIEDEFRPVLRARDITALTKILPVLAARYGGGAFTVNELMADSEERTPAGADLRLAIGSRTGQSIGKLFERTVGHVVAGHAVARAGEDGVGAVWRLIGNSSPIETPAAPKR
jgi:hypothetical protein